MKRQEGHRCCFYYDHYSLKNNIGKYLSRQFFKLWAGRNDEDPLVCVGWWGRAFFISKILKASKVSLLGWKVF